MRPVVRSRPWHYPIAARIAAAAFALAITACGGGGSGSDGAEPAPTVPVLNVSSSRSMESDGVTTFTISLSEPATEIVSFTASAQGGTADAGTDFEPYQQTHSIPVGASEIQIAVALINDEVAEPLEAIVLEISDLDGASAESGIGVNALLDDDSGEISTFDPHWDPTGVFTAASDCSECHRASPEGVEPAVLRAPAEGEVLPDPHGEEISPGVGRKHSVMAHSFDDPYFQAVMQDETAHFSDLSGLIEDRCLNCHSPMGYTHAHQTGTGLDADGYYRAATAKTQMLAREGVSCTLCHQIQDDGNLGTDTGFSGHFTIDDDPASLEIFGPFQNPVTAPMEQRVGYTPKFGAHTDSSAICATCHNLYTPTLDPETGQPTGNQFLEQGPYFEWLNSDYRVGGARHASCQDCHMPKPDSGGYSTRLAIRPNQTVNTAWPERSPYFAHEFAGGNTHILSIMRDFRDLLGIDGNTTVAGFDDKMDQTRKVLANAAKLSLQEEAVAGDRIEIAVTIENQTGHKLPTSYPSRRMWIELVVTDADGERIFASGVPGARGHLDVDENHLAAACLSAAKPEDFDNTPCYEPHRDVITSDAQVAIYESVLADNNGNIAYLLLLGDHYLKDNRIPPAGFTTDSANFEPDTAPVGVAADPDFNIADGTEGSGTDTVHYRIGTAGATPPYTVRTRLLYQSIRPTFVAALHPDQGAVTQFQSMYLRVPPRVEEIAAMESQVAP